MDTTELTLRWEKFGLSRGLHEMLGAGELVDVTLACQGEYLQAHKTVLAACSQHFRQIFIMNPCQHPVVFMQDVQLPHLQALLCFMYTGEATIGQSELPALLKMAQALRVSGLATANQELEQSSDKRGVSEKPDMERSSQPTPSPPPPSKRARHSSVWRDSMPPLQQAPSQPPPPPPRTSLPVQTAVTQPPPLLHPVDIKLEDDLSLEEAGEDDWPPDVAASVARPHFVLNESHPEGVWFDAGPSTSGQSQPGTSQDCVAVSNRGKRLKLDKKIRIRFKSNPPQQDSGDTMDSVVTGPSRRRDGPRNHVCRTCGKTFLTNSNLTRHEKNEHGADSAPATCEHCHKVLKNTDSLLSHVRIYHTGGYVRQRHACAICGRTYGQKKNLRNHERAIHAEYFS